MLVINYVGYTRFFSRSRDKERWLLGRSYALVALEHGVSESRLLSGVAHPRPESGRSSRQCLGCYMTMGLAYTSQRLGWGRTVLYSRICVSSRHQGHLGPLRQMSPRCRPQYGGEWESGEEVSIGVFPYLPV